MHHIHQLVSWSVAFDLEGGHFDAQVPLKTRLRSEHQLANARMQAVRADDEVERTRAMTFKGDPHLVSRLVYPDDGVIEDRVARESAGAARASTAAGNPDTRRPWRFTTRTSRIA